MPAPECEESAVKGGDRWSSCARSLRVQSNLRRCLTLPIHVVKNGVQRARLAIEIKQPAIQSILRRREILELPDFSCKLLLQLGRLVEEEDNSFLDGERAQIGRAHV